MDKPRNNLAEQLARFEAEKDGTSTIFNTGLGTTNEKRLQTCLPSCIHPSIPTVSDTPAYFQIISGKISSFTGLV